MENVDEFWREDMRCRVSIHGKRRAAVFGGAPTLLVYGSATLEKNTSSISMGYDS